MIDLINEWKARRVRKAEAEAEACERTRIRLEKEVEHATKNMLSRPCPVNNSNCSRECVHFKPGYVDRFEFDGKIYFLDNYPVCRLWRNS